jgi:OMF family outer membrane factor
LPALVGPFGITDLRVYYSEPILDLPLIRRYRAFRNAADSSEFDLRAVRNRVAAMVARLYFAVQRARAMEESIEVQIQTDESLLKLASDRQSAGVGTGLDVTRANSRLAADRYRLIEAQNDSRTSELELLRAMGERLDTNLDLTDPLTASTETAQDVAEAIATAMKNRPEIRAEERRIDAARLIPAAARAERLPDIYAFADYGSIGNLNSWVPTRTMGFQLRIPIFDGGRQAAQLKTAESQRREVEVRAKDVRDGIEFEVRQALQSLASAREQLRAAKLSLKLVQDELELSRLRFESQVAPQIDVISAQAELAAARIRQVNALFALKSAEVELRRATGVEIR